MSINDDILVRFEDKVLPEPNSGCWLWIGYLNRGRYGIIKISGKNMLAHRASYSLYKSPIPEGLHVLHICDQPACVNPNHLYLGTHKENMKDKSNRGRISGELHPRSKLSDLQRLEIVEKYVPRKYSLRKLAREYNVDDATIHQIIKNPRFNKENK